MYEMFLLSPLNMTIIFALVALMPLLIVVGWFYSPRTRRLAIFMAAVIMGIVVLIALFIFIRMSWFPKYRL
jgi:hypothetical protein